MKPRFLAAITALGFGITLSCGPRTEGLDPSKLPENIRADYQVFAVKCSKCHGLSRPLQSGITDDDQWVMYVRRMRRQQGSGISHEDEQVVLRFLRWYAADLRQKQAEKRGIGAATPEPTHAPPPPSPPPSPPPPASAPPAPPPPPPPPPAAGGTP